MLASIKRWYQNQWHTQHRQEFLTLGSPHPRVDADTSWWLSERIRKLTDLVGNAIEHKMPAADIERYTKALDMAKEGLQLFIEVVNKALEDRDKAAKDAAKAAVPGPRYHVATDRAEAPEGTTSLIQSDDETAVPRIIGEMPIVDR